MILNQFEEISFGEGINTDPRNKQDPPNKPEKNIPVKPNKNPDPTIKPGTKEPGKIDPTRIEEPGKTDPTRIDEPKPGESPDPPKQ